MTDRRLRGVVLLLSLAGAGIAAYLTVAHFTHLQVACATGGCETVQTSRYAEVAGMPVAAIGLTGYLALAWTASSGGGLARAAGFAVAMVLLYVQAAVLHAFCQWCLASDAILVVLVPLTLLRAWREAPPAEGSLRRARHRSARDPARRAGRPRPRR